MTTGFLPDEAFVLAAVAEPRRLSAVRKTGLLDTAAEETFDRLTALVARVIDVPTVLLTLVDQDRDFLKSRFGMPASEADTRHLTGRTFCHFAIALGESLVVEDAMQHPRLSELESVQKLGARAYAGIPLLDDDGQAIGAMCAVDFAPRSWTERDLDVLREMAWCTMREIKLRSALNEARELLESREQMMAVVAHDLRTPLSVVTMYAQLLSREHLPEKSAKMVERLRRTADGMAQLIKSLLDIAQVEAGALVLTRQEAEPELLMRDAVAAHAAEAQREGILLSMKPAPGLPLIMVDYDRVMNVFDSLIGNALKFSRTGGSVTISASRAENGVRFAVTDTGEGIAPEELQGLLNRFWQVKLHERRGAGFGLAIASGLVSGHGGTMDARSIQGQGSEFAFTLPLAA